MADMKDARRLSVTGTTPIRHDAHADRDPSQARPGSREAALEPQRELWRYREGPPEAIGRVGLTHKFDVTVPQGDIPRFCDAVEKVVTALRTQ